MKGEQVYIPRLERSYGLSPNTVALFVLDWPDHGLAVPHSCHHRAMAYISHINQHHKFGFEHRLNCSSVF